VILILTLPVYADEFNVPVLDSAWSFVDPDGGSTYSLTTNPGWLEISTISPPGRDLYNERNSPRILRQIQGDFTIETKVKSDSFNQNDQGVGIVVWKDNDNFIRLDRMARSDVWPTSLPVNQEIIFIGRINGVWSMPDSSHTSPGGIVHLTSNQNPTYLKLVRTGNIFTGFYSIDGYTWINVTTITFSTPENATIGVATYNMYHEGSFTADVDYIRINGESPVNTLQVPLYQGWNFISTPKKLALGYNTGSIFTNVDMGGHSAFMWDGSQNPGHWDTLQANTPLLPLYGVWIYSTSSDVVDLQFDTTPMSTPPQRSLPAGWNMIGFAGLNPASARDTYLSVQPNWVNSIGFDPLTQAYKPSIFNGDSSESTILYPTVGYWLYMRTPGNLSAVGT
jgi:regulation of enolase protein 1 (concanavalin A-like superfamily)